MAGGEWDSAATSYEHAMAADPTFWLARARLVFAREWSLTGTPESVMTSLDSHRFELPERERLTTEAIVLSARDSIALSLERAREATERYPSSWLGWLLYGDGLLHQGPLLGHSQSESRAAFERAVELSPDLIPAREHLMLLALLSRDTAAVGNALRVLTRLDAGPALTADGFGNRMLQYRYLDGLVRGDSTLTLALTDSIASDPAPAAATTGTFYDPFRYGFFADQIRVSQEVLRRTGPAVGPGIHRWMLALSWAGRGAWDSALAAMDRFTASGTDSRAAFGSYAMAVVGAWVGAVEPREAAARREAAVASIGEDTDRRAELAWLDGVTAVTRRDRPSLAQARAELRRSGSPSVGALDRSLAAFEADLRGSRREAATAMARLEWEEAALQAPDFEQHPYAIAVNRLAAARWLAELGDGAQAARLLAWAEGPYLLHPTTVYSIMLAGLADLERGRIAQRSGQTELAARYYREFLRRYDHPVAAHRQLVAEAKAALETPLSYGPRHASTASR